MIAMLTGIVDLVSADSLVLDVNGVGYQVFASARTLREVPSRGQPLRLVIETQTREDRIQLYGFIDEAERGWFRLLNTVQGVGGRVALAILGVLDPDALTTAVLAQDKAAFVRADGVGPKLGQRIVNELKDKAGGIALSGKPTGVPSSGVSGTTADAVSALVNLGYSKSDAYKAVAEAAKKLGGEPRIDALIRAGLQELAR